MTSILSEHDKYRLIAENANDVIWVLNNDLQYIYISPSVKRLRGYEPSEIIGCDFKQLLPDEYGIKAQQTVEKYAKKAVEDSTFSLPPLEFRTKLKSGKIIWTEVNISVMRDTNGNHIGYIGVSRDINERKEMEERLFNSEKYFRTLIEKSEDLIIVANWELTIIYVSPSIEKMLGYKPSQVLGEKLDMLIKNKYFFESMKGECGRPEKSEAEFVDVLGRARAYEYTLTCQDPGSDINGIIINARDITERKKDEKLLIETIEKLKSSNESLEHFAYAASHDLKEPLRNVSGALQLLKRNLGGKLDEDSVFLLDSAVKGAKKMHDMIKAVLQYSKLRRDTVKDTTFSLNEALEMALSMLNQEITASQAVITADKLPSVKGEKEHFELLFMNLINNAIKYRSEEIPKIKISSRICDGFYLIDVSDNGIGISGEYAEKVFGIFCRLHSDDRVEGTGIGLTVCRKIVELYRGKIWIESNAEKGSVFKIKLPYREVSNE